MDSTQTHDWNSIWSAALAEWQLSATTAFYNTCLKQSFIKQTKQENNHIQITVGIGNIFWLDELQRRFHPTVVKTLERLTNSSVVVTYEVASKPSSDLASDLADTPLFAEEKTVPDVDEKLFLEEVKRNRLDPQRSLDNFAVSSSNEMAYAAAKAVSQRPGDAYNPLFLYGGVGVGKTHLMQGIGQIILKNNMSTKIIYCSGEEFTNAIIEAIQKKSTPKFRNKYRTVRLLMIDDIQFIAGKNSVQEEFFHTFNAITTSGGQVIMTSDKPPKEIDALEDRLRSRFEGGLTIDIGQPNFELRCAILLIKAEQMQIAFPTEVIQYVANNELDTRALVGRLIKISMLATSRKTLPSIELAQEIFEQDKPNIPTPEPLTSEKIVKMVADYYNQPAQAILGASRVKQLTLPRHMAMYLLKEELGLNLKDIGQTFGGRDHTSVIHAVRKVTKLIKTDLSVSQDLQQLKAYF